MTQPEERAPRRPAHPRTRLFGRTFAVGAVSLAAGVLFATNARLFSADDGRQLNDAADLVAVEGERLANLEAEVSQLRDRRQELLAAADGMAQLPTVDGGVALGAAATGVRGPGVQVSLWDAPAIDTVGTNFDVNDLVVHQQDIEAVMNALWAGGAEAMTVQGQRLTATSGIRCVGNVLLLHGQQFSPPYVIEAIGDPDALMAALDDSPEVQLYLQYVESVRLGWEAHRLDAITMPPYQGGSQVTHARVLGE